VVVIVIEVMAVEAGVGAGAAPDSLER